MIYKCPSCSSPNRIPSDRLDARARCGSCKTALLPLDHPYDIHDATAFDELVRESPLPVVVDFWAPWCGPCQMMNPELKKLATALAGKVVFAKVNSDNLPDLAARYRIRGIPALLRFDDGKETKRVAGAQTAEALAQTLGLDRTPPAEQAHAR